MVRLLLSLIVNLFFFQHANATPSSMSEIYLGSRESDPASIVENVSTLHGDYTEVEVDLTVAAPDSLILSRFYSSRDPLSMGSFGGWRFNPHCLLIMQKDPTGKSYSSSDGKFERTFAYVGNSDGSILTYVGWNNITHLTNRILFMIDAEGECNGVSNTAKGEISAWTNLKNHQLYYDPQNDSFELLLCSEGRRFYEKSVSGSAYLMTHEILPSGNKIFYEFNDKEQLTLIKEMNESEKKVLAWIKIEYGKGVHVETSDGKTADYQFQQDSSGSKLLTAVTRSCKPNLHYQYRIANDHALLIKKILPEGRFTQIDYFQDKANCYKVKTITTPAGSFGTSATQFIYGQDYTEVNGPGSCKSIYRFNEDFRLIAIEQYLDGVRYRIHQKLWGTKIDAGNLIATSVADGIGNIFYHKLFIYDRMNTGNIVEEREYGDIAGTGAFALQIDEEGVVSNQDGHIKNYAYFSGKSTHGFFQRDVKGTGVKCWYKKGTNLLIKKFILMKGSSDSEDENIQSDIKKRYFYTYNEDAALIRLVVDDGFSADPNNFFGVTQRLITKISPKQEMPNIGAPEVIEQKCSSSNGKSESLLKKIIHHFDSQGNIVSQNIYDADDIYRYTINKKYARGLLIFETDAMGNETHYAYDANQNLISEMHSNTGVSIEYGYDLINRLTYTIEKDRIGNQFKTQITYDAAGYPYKEIDPFGNEILTIHDSLGRPISITYPETSDGWQASLKPTYTYTYDIFDHPISVKDPKGRVLTRSYNVKGKPAEIHFLDGTKEIFKYDSGGSLHHHYCRNGLLEVFEYDRMGRQNLIRYYAKGEKSSGSASKKISFEYNAFHKISDTDASFKNTTYQYDPSGRLMSLKKENQKVELIYDSLGRLHTLKKWKSATDFSLEIKEYDLLNRIIEERTEDSTGNILTRKKIIYNEAGEMARIIGYPQNQESVLLKFEYDGFGRLSKATNAVGNVIQVIYDDTYLNDWGQKGRKRTLIDSIGNQTEEIFDNEGQLIQVCKKDPSGKLLSRIDTSYDCFGNKILEKSLIISPNESNRYHQIDYSYQLGDRLASITIAKGKSEEQITRFEYYPSGELAKEYQPGSPEPITYQYNKFADLEAVSYKENKKEIKFNLSFDYHKNLLRMSKDQLSLNYTYDGNDLPLSETIQDEFGSYQVSRTYDGEGKIKALQFPDGSTVEYHYQGPLVKSVSRFSKDKKELYTYKVASRDQMGNIIQENLPGRLGARTQTWDSSARKLGIVTEFFQDKVLKYDQLDNIKKRETSLEKETFTTDYDYNALLQLISEKGKIQHTYSYDSIDNRLKKDQSPCKINSLNQLIEAQGKTYTFHPNGNIATKTINGKTWTYQSNPLNQIVSIKDPDQNITTFTYDLNGRRLSKRMSSNKTSKIFRFFYLGETEIGCVDDKGALLELKIPSNPNHPEDSCIAIEVKKGTYIPLYDLQGNIVCLLDHIKRNIVESYRYSVYGEEEITNEKGKVVADSPIGNPWRYRGKRIDKEVELIYFGYRYYDPENGRWISQDPAGTIDGPNLYAFVHNNPIKYIDDFGFNSKIAENCGCTDHGHPGWHYAPPDCVCICGKDGASEGAAGSYRSTRGSDIKSSLAGISHGVVDFVIGSLQDLHTAAAYIGYVELDISLHERMHMIETLEHSQMQQLAAVESYFTGMLSIDESDAHYQFMRSTTTVGLEIASLLTGGYGAVKGVLGFTKLARTPMQVAKIAGKVASQELIKTTTATRELNRFNQAARSLSFESKNNIRILRGWAKSKGWKQFPTNGGPEKWGTYLNTKFQWNLIIKPEPSFRLGLEIGSNSPRFDARLGPGGNQYINPFIRRIGDKEVGTHIPLDFFIN